MELDRMVGLNLFVLVIVFSAGAVWADIPKRSGLSMYIARMVGTALPYKEEDRWESYLTISRVAEVLVHEDRYREGTAILTTETFTGFPLLFLTDNDGDHRADSFAYHETDEREFTREFGAFFTVGGGPEPAWIVFNNGTIPEELTGDDWVFFWATHQFVDRNGDGQFDLYIGNGNDPDSDGKTGVHETVWAFDDDFDGRLDRAEINISGQVHELKPVEGVFSIGGLGNIQANAPAFMLGDAIAGDILTALEGSAR